MAEKLHSLGLDVGTTTTQLIFSELEIENRASPFSVPEMGIGERRVIYESPVRFTPMLDGHRVDGDRLRQLVEAEFRAAGLPRSWPDTGAVIITGETSRKENAGQVLRSLAEFAGEFVVATAGPDLESVLAARGAGAVDFSEKTGKTVLHMDIGGGTANLALIRAGEIAGTGCFNVGGRLLRFDENGKITYVSPAISQLTTLKPGEIPTESELSRLCERLTEALMMAAGLIPPGPLLEMLRTPGSNPDFRVREPVTLSFSGGVADCMENTLPPLAFGDLGPLLGQTIRKSALCRGDYMLGKETIRATVIGAGCHSAQLSGSTVFCKNMALPLKNLPAGALSAREQLDGQAIRRKFRALDGERKVLALPGLHAPSYGQVKAIARLLAENTEGPMLFCTEQDMAKALGQCLHLLAPDRPCLCLDGLRLRDGDYLDVGKPLGPALPVVIKTLILSR